MSKRVGRSAALGLVGALGLGAIVMLASAVLRLRVDCTGLGVEECNFEEQLAAGIARTQALGALGSGLLAAGGALLLKRR